jgi:SAM-dependent methyltransferase
LKGKIEFLLPDELTAECFDLALSEDCFEHYEDPERIMKMLRNYLKPDGRVFIGFSPLWKSPSGGHINYMTKLPWAHLLFPERIIMLERRRYRPDEDARTFAEMRGGLNKMTYAKFLTTMRASGYRIDYLASNISESKLIPAVNVVRRLPFCFEYFTKNLYAIVRPEHAQPLMPGPKV